MKPDDTRQAPDLDETRLTNLAQSALDASVEHLDGATLSKLNQARQQAIATEQHSRLRQNWLPVAAMAFSVVLLVTLLPGPQPGEPPGAVEPSVDELYYRSAEDLELVEDLDLVLWLMEAEDHAS